MSFVLVCGGAGYIGSHMCKLLARTGIVPVTFDNLSTEGHLRAVRWGPLVEGDPPILVASNSLVAEKLQWDPRSLRDCVRDALAWHRGEAGENLAQGRAD